MEPMFLDTPLMWAIRLGTFALMVTGVLVGLLWIRRLTSVAEAHVFRATGAGERRWRAYAVGLGVVLLLAVAAILVGTSLPEL